MFLTVMLKAARVEGHVDGQCAASIKPHQNIWGSENACPHNLYQALVSPTPTIWVFHFL